MTAPRVPITMGGFTAAYQSARTMPLRPGFVLVTNPRRRHALVHIVEADSFGALAKLMIRGEPVKTLCDRATVASTWEFVPRQPNGGYLISCALCRGALSHHPITPN